MHRDTFVLALPESCPLAGSPEIKPSQCIALRGVVYRSIAGKPIGPEIAIAYRKFERAPAVRVFLEFARSR